MRPPWYRTHADLTLGETDMRVSEPTPGDFIVEYRKLSHSRRTARVAVLQLTPDAGPEELFTSNAARCGERAEHLATLWAFEEGTRAWRVMTGEGDRSLLQPIGIDARSLGSMGGVRASVLASPPKA
jgi:hypothetical protein